MSRALNALVLKKGFKLFGIPRGSPKVNHLAFADDMIILCKAEIGTMQMVNGVLERYEKMSGQKINKEKSAIYLHDKVSQGDVVVAEVATGILRKEFPFTYLGCPIFYRRKQKAYYQQMINRISTKLQAWKGKLLSYAGRAILIKHVLQSIPVHCLSVMNPPSNVISTIQKMMTQFFWSSCMGGKGRHWTSWSKLCLPEAEGGLGFRMLHDVSMALFCKLWWNFRTQSTIWSEFMLNKYCKKENQNAVIWKVGYCGSQVWKKMLQARDHIEHQIWWQTKNGSAHLWHDNWTGLGDLYSISDKSYEWDDRYQQVKDIKREGEWVEQLMEEIFPVEVANFIKDNIRPPRDTEENDKPAWMLETSGKFSVKSAWSYIRHKEQPSQIINDLWVQGMPFKMTFLMWRLLEI
ncbi:hypothetical protein MTR67_018088 [Solanum verrucosum]|uniref:Reverse transcriptase zinc-binding domain-containing protein n=1 Tax=Solanum verrucosum TaxID=315347 RepID=A0AAF0QKC3_SOLVR|nr:hypothetical protein MTR67_018088 [Solanum verrucosum]